MSSIGVLKAAFSHLHKGNFDFLVVFVSIIDGDGLDQLKIFVEHEQFEHIPSENSQKDVAVDVLEIQLVMCVQNGTLHSFTTACLRLGLVFHQILEQLLNLFSLLIAEHKRNPACTRHGLDDLVHKGLVRKSDVYDITSTVQPQKRALFALLLAQNFDSHHWKLQLFV